MLVSGAAFFLRRVHTVNLPEKKRASVPQSVQGFLLQIPKQDAAGVRGYEFKNRDAAGSGTALNEQYFRIGFGVLKLFV